VREEEGVRGRDSITEEHGGVIQIRINQVNRPKEDKTSFWNGKEGGQRNNAGRGSEGGTKMICVHICSGPGMTKRDWGG